MNKHRQQLSILVVLLAVLGLTLVFGYRMESPISTAAVQSVAQVPGEKGAVGSDARIHIDHVENSTTPSEIGQKNLFQYGSAPKPPEEESSSVPEVVAPPPVQTAPPPFVPSTPPPPPPIPLKFTGFAIVNSSITAFVSSDISGNFIVTAGEVLMGRYRITQITDSSIEVEDLENNRRQLIALQK